MNKQIILFAFIMLPVHGTSAMDQKTKDQINDLHNTLVKAVQTGQSTTIDLLISQVISTGDLDSAYALHELAKTQLGQAKKDADAFQLSKNNAAQLISGVGSLLVSVSPFIKSVYSSFQGKSSSGFSLDSATLLKIAPLIYFGSVQLWKAFTNDNAKQQLVVAQATVNMTRNAKNRIKFSRNKSEVDRTMRQYALALQQKDAEVKRMGLLMSQHKAPLFASPLLSSDNTQQSSNQDHTTAADLVGGVLNLASEAAEAAGTITAAVLDSKHSHSHLPHISGGGRRKH